MLSVSLFKCFNIFSRISLFILSILVPSIVIYLWIEQIIPINDYMQNIIFLLCMVILMLVFWLFMLMHGVYCDSAEQKFEKYCYQRVHKRFDKLIRLSKNLDEKFKYVVPECSICMDKPQSIVYNCGHSGVCRDCAILMRGKPCPFCRNIVKSITMNVYDSNDYHPELDQRIDIKNKTKNTIFIV